MNPQAPPLRPPFPSVVGSALLVFAILAVLLPTAIYPWELPRKPARPDAPQPLTIAPPQLDAPLPSTVPSPIQAPVPAPTLADPDPRPDLKPLDIRPEPFIPPDGGISIHGIVGTVAVELLPDSWETLDRPPDILFRPGPRVSWKPSSTFSVLIELIVETDGSVSSVKVLSADNEELARACVAAAARWRFSPGIRNGQPVRFSMRQRFNFRP